MKSMGLLLLLGIVLSACNGSEHDPLDQQVQIDSLRKDVSDLQQQAARDKVFRERVLDYMRSNRAPEGPSQNQPTPGTP